MSYQTCSDAYAAGVSDIPRSSANYAKRLDRDGDGVGCETKDAPAGFVKAPATHATTAQPKGNALGDSGSTLPKTGPGSVLLVGLLVVVIGVAAIVGLRRRRVRFTA